MNALEGALSAVSALFRVDKNEVWWSVPGEKMVDLSLIFGNGRTRRQRLIWRNRCRLRGRG